MSNTSTIDKPIALPVALGLLLLLYVALRVGAWMSAPLLEDHDSVQYIQQIEAFASFDWTRIDALSPDVTPFYPFVGALASLPGWGAEAGARFASLLLSVVLFFAAAAIVRRQSDRAGALLGVAILALSPYLIEFSVSVLSEPAYLGVVYVGLWYFLATYRTPSFRTAAVLGVIFGCAFLNRLEALLFLGLIPVLQSIALFVDRPSRARVARMAGRWSAAFIAVYVLIAAPQVWHVSAKMDRFALNGRGVWAQLLQAPGDASFDARIYGLDYSPTRINLVELQSNPDSAAGLASSYSLVHHAETTLRNIDKLHAVNAGVLGGPLLVTFFVLGLVACARPGRGFELFALGAFIAAFLLPGIVTDPKPRAVATVVPLLAIFSGPGILFAARGLAQAFPPSRLVRWLPAALFGLLLLVWLVPLLGTQWRQREENVEYSLVDLRQPVTLLQTAAAGRTTPARVATRKFYVSRLAGAESVWLPYTDYAGLVTYFEANTVEFLFLEHYLLGEYPFITSFRGAAAPPEFTLLYSAVDRHGQPLQLYRFNGR